MELTINPPSYHDVRVKLLKQAVEIIDLILQEYRNEWKRTIAQLCLMGGQIKKGVVF